MVDVLRKRCFHDSCTRRPNFNVKDSKTPLYCKQHAEVGMVKFRTWRCLHDTCMKWPCFNVEGSKIPIRCRQHSEDGMVNVLKKHCLNDSCTRRPTFDVVGSKTPTYCKQHAEDGMVDVSFKHCSYPSCTRHPNFNTEGSKTPIYCKQHAEAGMVDVRRKHCFHDSCTRRPNFNVKDSKTPVYCKQHAEVGMVNVRGKRCAHATCMKCHPLTSRAARHRHTARNMLTTEWLTSAPGVLVRNPAQRGRHWVYQTTLIRHHAPGPMPRFLTIRGSMFQNDRGGRTARWGLRTLSVTALSGTTSLKLWVWVPATDFLGPRRRVAFGERSTTTPSERPPSRPVI